MVELESAGSELSGTELGSHYEQLFARLSLQLEELLEARNKIANYRLLLQRQQVRLECRIFKCFEI